MEIKLGNHKINLSLIKEGVEIDTENKFLKKYDTDGNSIFSAEEIAILQKDLETFAGEDKTLQNNEILDLYSKKMELSLEEAKKKFNKYGNIVEKGILEIFSSHNDKIVKEIGDVIDSNWTMGSIHTDKFQSAFKQINNKNIIEILKLYRKRFNGENLPTAIMREITSSTPEKLKAVEFLYETLYLQIDKTKYSTKEVEKIFNEFLKDPINESNIDNLDLLFNTMIAMIEGTATEGEVNLDLATGLAKNRTQAAQETADNKEDSQGKVSDALDKLAGMAHGMTKEQVDEIIKEHEEELARLESKKGDYKEYCAEFEKIFGIAYKPSAIQNFNNIQKKYENAQYSYLYEQSFLNTFEKEFEQPDIDKLYTHVGLKAAESKYNEFYKKLCEFFTTELVDNYLKAAGAEDLMPHVKYKVLQEFLKAQKELIHSYTVEQCGGMEFSELESARNSAYHAAYGSQKDSYLIAKDWVNAQEERFSNAQMAFNVAAMAGTVLTGGTFALISTAALLLDPIQFTEQATDADGMTKEDWNAFLQNRAETLGWMALGMGAGAVGNIASKFVKLKGLSSLMNNGGKSLDDLLKNPNIPSDLRGQLVKLKNIVDLTGISTETLVDITATALLQKDGATTGDWIASLAGAIAGTKLAPKLARMEPENAIKALQETFPDLKITKDEALLVIKNINDKVKNWANSPTKPNGQLNSSIIPGITPENIEAGVKLVAKGVTKVIDSLLKNIDNKNYLNDIEKVAIEKYTKKYNGKYNTELQDALNEIAHRIYQGEYPSKDMLNEVLNGITQKYPGIDKDDFINVLEIIMEDYLSVNGWDNILECMKYSEKKGQQLELDEMYVEPFKEARGWSSTSEEIQNPTNKTNESEANSPKNSSSNSTVEQEPKIEKSKNEQENNYQNNTSDTNFDYDEMLKIYPQVENVTFFGGIESQIAAIKFLEEYPTIMQKEGISFETFHEMEYVIYQHISYLNINSNDLERVFNLVKEYYHQDVIKNDLRIENIKKDFNINTTEHIAAGDKIISEIRTKITNGEKIDNNFIRQKLEEFLPYEYDATYQKIEKYIYSFEDINNFVNDCTHKNIYENKNYQALYPQETIDNCVKTLDSILTDFQSGKELTPELIESYMNNDLIKLSSGGQELLDDILSKHRILGSIYNNIKK